MEILIWMLVPFAFVIALALGLVIGRGRKQSAPLPPPPQPAPTTASPPAPQPTQTSPTPPKESRWKFWEGWDIKGPSVSAVLIILAILAAAILWREGYTINDAKNWISSLDSIQFLPLLAISIGVLLALWGKGGGYAKLLIVMGLLGLWLGSERVAQVREDTGNVVTGVTSGVASLVTGESTPSTTGTVILQDEKTVISLADTWRRVITPPNYCSKIDPIDKVAINRNSLFDSWSEIRSKDMSLIMVQIKLYPYSSSHCEKKGRV